MLLERLSVENYGVYEGRSDFDLTTTKERPIVLIGGLNGAGKTTIFECIMVALYGKTYLGRRATKKDYAEFVARRIHSHGGRRASSASVELAFRFYHGGSEDGYAISRSWEVERASVSESLSVRKNGEAMSDVDESQWQSFIEGLIPLGIARLFFFDGERVVRITEWGNRNNEEVKASLDMLLGTELINRLYADLDLYVLRRSGSKACDEANQKHEKLQKEKSLLASEIDSLATERARKDREMKEIASKIGAQELSVSGVGGGYASIRSELIKQQAVLKEMIRHQSRTILDDLSEDAPLYLMPAMLNKIRRRIEEDADIIRRRAFASMAEEQIPKIRRNIESAKLWPEGTNTKLASAEIVKILEEVFETPQESALFDMAPNDAVQIVQKISGLEGERKMLRSNIAEYESTVTEFGRIEAELAKVPKDDEIGPQISRINAMHEECGVLRAELAHIDQIMSKKRAYLSIVQNKLKAAIDSIHRSKAADRGIRLAAKMQGVLEAYSTNLKEQKMSRLESNLLETARLLLHKNMVSGITIDRETLEIKTYGPGGAPIPGGLMSMGERQIVGTALLWAIARTSGRSLPFVIDTPLGRLDGEHLSNLTDRFYPSASHQLILLSTDREIGPKEYAKLSPHTSRSYRITCDESKSVTTVADGYFVEEHVA